MPPVRSTSYRTSVVRDIQRYADSYIIWCAGHGTDSITLSTYIESFSVFPSHFMEWASSYSDEQLEEALTCVSFLLPNRPLFPSPVPQAGRPMIPPPPAVSLVLTLAIQGRLLVPGSQIRRGDDLQTPYLGAAVTAGGGQWP